jgi:hypothetical protein
MAVEVPEIGAQRIFGKLPHQTVAAFYLLA